MKRGDCCPYCTLAFCSVISISTQGLIRLAHYTISRELGSGRHCSLFDWLQRAFQLNLTQRTAGKHKNNGREIWSGERRGLETMQEIQTRAALISTFSQFQSLLSQFLQLNFIRDKSISTPVNAECISPALVIFFSSHEYDSPCIANPYGEQWNGYYSFGGVAGCYFKVINKTRKFTLD